MGGARTPIAKLLGGFKDLSATDLGGHAISAALARAGVTGDQIEYVIMGQVLQAGVGQIPARQAAVKGGVADVGSGPHGEQGVPLRPQRDRPRRSADPGRRVRTGRGRRDGVDDPGAASAAGGPRRNQVRRRHPGGLDGLRRSLGRLHRSGDGCPDRGRQPRGASGEPGGSGRVRGAFARTGTGRHEGGAAGRGDRAGNDPAAPRRGPGDLGRRGHPTRCRSRRSGGDCGRPSPRRAPSRRGPPARSRTGRRR